jgi:hypothetical protein
LILGQFDNITYRGMNEFNKEKNSQLSEEFVVLNIGRLDIFFACVQFK